MNKEFEQHLVRFRNWSLLVRIAFASLVAIVFELGALEGQSCRAQGGS